MKGDYAEVKRNEAIAYYDMGRYEQAENIFREALSEDPDDELSLMLMANCCFMLDKYDEAEEDCKSLLTGYHATQAFRLMGKIERERKRYKKSEEYLLKALELDPQDAETLAEYGYLLLLCGYIRKADEVMKEAVRIDPEDSIVLHYKYYYELALGNRRKEEAAIERYVNSSSSEVQNLVKMGLTEYKSNRFKAAKEYFRQAFLLEPTNGDILDILEELDRVNHFIFLPNRFFSRLNPVIRFAVVPVITIVLFILLAMLSGTHAIIFIIAFLACTILFTVWSWLSLPIYNAFFKVKR